MITFNELLERANTEKLVVHTPTEKEAKILLKMLDKRGFVWNSKKKLTSKNYYEEYRENTSYDFSRDYYRNILDKKVVYGSLDWHQDEGYTIIEFSEIDFKKNA